MLNKEAVHGDLWPYKQLAFKNKLLNNEVNITNSQVFAKGKTQRTAKGIVTSSPTQETTSFVETTLKAIYMHKSRHTETCDNITSKGMVGRSGNMKATSTEILLESCRAVFAGVATVLFTMGYCYRLSPKPSHKSVILHAVVSHQIKFFLQRCVCYLSGIQRH